METVDPVGEAGLLEKLEEFNRRKDVLLEELKLKKPIADEYSHVLECWQKEEAGEDVKDDGFRRSLFYPTRAKIYIGDSVKALVGDRG